MSIDLKQISIDYISYSDSDIWGSTKSIKAKEINHIYAPSGIGKTSFLKILYQGERSYSGSVLIDGRDLNDIDTSELRTKHFSIVFQDSKLISGLTGLDNVMLRADLFSISKEEAVEEAKSEDDEDYNKSEKEEELIEYESPVPNGQGRISSSAAIQTESNGNTMVAVQELQVEFKFYIVL